MSEIRDPIHGFILPNSAELKIINTSIFQRLRRIKQLALTNLVYPSANHSRFDHSLGVFHIANMMAGKLLPGSENDDKRRIIRLSALLHDIGHGSFSHVSEQILKKYSKAVSKDKTKKIHEKITAKLIQTNSEIKSIVGKDSIQQIVGLLGGTSVELSIMKEIVSGAIDADKQDYLLRDSYFCGVKYGVYDIHRLINTLEKYSDNGDEHLCIMEDGINALEQFVLAKYYMYKQVYFHKVRLVSDAMLIRGVELGIEKDRIKFLRKLYTYQNTEDYLDRFLSWWDDKFFVTLLSMEKGGFAVDIFKRLFERNLFKTIYHEDTNSDDMKQLPRIKMSLLDINEPENAKLKAEIEKEIARKIKVQPEYVIANLVKIESVREMSRDSEGAIPVKSKFNNISNFEQKSAIFRSIDESLKETYFEVYAPVVYKDAQDKNKKLKNYKKFIEEILKDIERQIKSQKGEKR